MIATDESPVLEHRRLLVRTAEDAKPNLTSYHTAFQRVSIVKFGHKVTARSKGALIGFGFDARCGYSLSPRSWEARSSSSDRYFIGRKDFLPVEPQSGLSFLFLLGAPRFA